MQKIVPHIWFDKGAEDAAAFYAEVFDEARVVGVSRYPDAGQENHGQPAGSPMTVEFEIAGFTFLAINAGPVFTLNPMISFLVNFNPSKIDDAVGELNRHFAALSEGGKVLMELGEYPFSKHYSWIEDRYGVSWQLMLTDETADHRPFINPQLMFANDNVNKAEEAIKFYTSIFDDSRIGAVSRYPDDMQMVKAGAVGFADFQLADVWFSAIDSPVPHDFDFNEGVSLLVNCDTQEEIDRYWSRLSAVPEAEQCGWLKDRFGVSWQIVPQNMWEIMASDDPERIKRNFEAMMQMKKIDMSKFD